MFELCRKIVAGPKKKLEWNDKQLDLTYVTDRIIAMAFPASGLQKAYRNSIKDVSQYLHQKHGDNYLIINVSSRKYDYKYFNNNVLEYQWRDHLSPPLSTLFQIGRKMYDYIKKNKKNVIAVHCNHGKGRTGTTIIAFLIYTGFFEKFDEALSFYNKRRFVSLTYGVSQPCQKRYLSYFEILKTKQKISPKLVTYKLKSIKQKGLTNEKYFLQISSIRNAEPKYKQLFFSENSKKLYPNVPLIGDICIEIAIDKWNGQDEVAMINCHTFFLNENQNCLILDESLNQKLYTQKTISSLSISRPKQEKFDGKSIKVNGKHTLDFQIFIDFQWFCHCHLEGKNNPDCPCQAQRIVEEKIWKRTVQNVEVSKNISKLEACSLLFNVDYLHEEGYAEQMKKQKQIPKQVKNGSLQSAKNTSSSQVQVVEGEQKWGSSSSKGSNLEPFSNSPSQSQSNISQGQYYGQDFEYDMVIVNRNSTNSV